MKIPLERTNRIPAFFTQLFQRSSSLDPFVEPNYPIALSNTWIGPGEQQSAIAASESLLAMLLAPLNNLIATTSPATLFLARFINARREIETNFNFPSSNH